MKIKVGDRVRLQDYSYSMTVKDGEIRTTGHHTSLPAEEFVVLYTNMVLPSDRFRDHLIPNDTILQNINDKERILFTNSRFIAYSKVKYLRSERFILNWLVDNATIDGDYFKIESSTSRDWMLSLWFVSEIAGISYEDFKKRDCTTETYPEEWFCYK